MNHSECQNKLIEMGRKLDFSVFDRTKGKLYKLASADCVWYLKPNPSSAEFVQEMAKDDEFDTIPVIAFEVANSEQEKTLRGSVYSLHLLNASASVIVLIGRSLEKHSYLKDLLSKFALGRIHIWTEEDVLKWYGRIVGGQAGRVSEEGTR